MANKANHTKSLYTWDHDELVIWEDALILTGKDCCESEPGSSTSYVLITLIPALNGTSVESLYVYMYALDFTFVSTILKSYTRRRND